jgi:TrmH family RNA methyltransferase
VVALITSAANPRLKLVKKLQSRSQRRKLGLFVAEGEDLLSAGLEAGLEAVDVLRAGEDVEPELLAGVSELPHPPRVVAVFRTADLPGPELRPIGLALWRVADPGNVGALIRTADAFGAFVALSRGCADPTSPKALRGSAGAAFRVPLLDFGDPPKPWVALVAHGGTPIAEATFPEPASFVLGAEREGVPPEILKDCDTLASIPMAVGVESLNVAAAGAIALYEWSRARSRA